VLYEGFSAEEGGAYDHHRTTIEKFEDQENALGTSFHYKPTLVHHCHQ
jgi:hypothetical protein